VVSTPDKLPAVATPFRWLAAMPPGWAPHRLAELACRHGIMPAPTYVHPTARVDAAGCELGVGGVIGPCAVIEAGVKLGKGIIVYPYVTVTAATRPLDYDIVKPADWNRSRQAEACAWKL
jgi:UDP-3-O-[3-hydroxymyristoyl] glucosamine N-acyltransferase